MVYSGQERRRHPRIPMNVPVLISGAVGSRQQDDIGYLLNLSVEGAAVFTNLRFPSGTTIMVHFGAAFREAREPLAFHIEECSSARGHSQYRYRLRAILRERRKHNLQLLASILQRCAG